MYDKLILSAALLVVAVVSPLSEASKKLTAGEIAALPPYCAGRYARSTNIQEYKRWEAQYGPDFLHVHHLCDGIALLRNVYKAKNAMQKNGILNEAMGNLNYMVQHAKPDFRLMPEVYWYRSQTFNQMGRMGEAMADIERAIGLDPTQARFYVQMAQYLERLGRKDDALRRVSEGMQNIPGNKTLEGLYIRLGGTPPFPEPVEKQSDVPATSEAGNVQGGERPMEKGVETKIMEDSDAREKSTASKSAEPQPARTQSAEQPIGTAKNPWCRFCPKPAGQ